MPNESANCPYCQTLTEPGERFCISCGAALESRAVSTPDEETVIGLIPQVVEVKGILGLSTQFMTMVVTPRRLILAEQPEDMNEQHTEYEWKIEEHISNHATTWREFMDSTDFSSAPWSRYQTMSADAIQAEQPHNRSIPMDAIEDLVLELYSEEEDHMDSIKIKTGDALLDLTLPWGNGRLAQKLLTQVREIRVVQA